MGFGDQLDLTCAGKSIRSGHSRHTAPQQRDLANLGSENGALPAKAASSASISVKTAAAVLMAAEPGKTQHNSTAAPPHAAERSGPAVVGDDETAVRTVG